MALPWMIGEDYVEISVDLDDNGTRAEARIQKMYEQGGYVQAKVSFDDKTTNKQ
ncbi:hypothetical protein [Helicobacter felis]|uniref:Uncharacterized protein n=1 Tax=Helicobacter felis (strain ATCC 49179 / CCUG 28539 / NCTC 12436 / CS1) TaxID=936155 RepID=E7ABJ1_HELFC|nr:hypothetical protein [Helicobacter felis]CBY82870.1 putative uncharacterized protein [Helicobacter felis ATCC 49179]